MASPDGRYRWDVKVWAEVAQPTGPLNPERNYKYGTQWIPVPPPPRKL